MPSRSINRLFALTLLLLGACDGGGGGGDSPRGPGEYCTGPGECTTGVCDQWQCTDTCTSDADCAALGALDRCSPLGLCVETCSPERSEVGSGLICVDGNQVSCAALDDSYCDLCDTKCPGQRCVPEVGCAPLADVGEQCEGDSDCRTGNCSRYRGVCRVPLGAACDETNCDLCLTDESGWSFCSRDCTFGDDCNGSERCVGRTALNMFWCRADCGASCPGECQFTSDSSIRFCEPRIGDFAMESEPRRELEPCRIDSECAGGTCVSTPSCDSRSAECSGSRGFCSDVCASDADCGAAGRCVDLPCSGTDTSECGPRCLPACGGSSLACNVLGDADCRSLPGVSGTAVSVCDPRNSEGERCRSGDDCTTGACSSQGRCTASGGASNGSPCAAPSDCASGNCQSSTCRGTSLRGDPCSTPFDCSVGTCVSGICD